MFYWGTLLKTEPWKTVSQLSLRDYFKESRKEPGFIGGFTGKKKPKTCSCTSKDVHKN